MINNDIITTEQKAANGTWYDEEIDTDEDESPIGEYDLTASPNDFNINTLFDFITKGVVKIPGFQRNYVWDIKRASKLIESIILGLPIPQIFLYEEARNRFLVIDGQQRLMSIYYFKLQRFPREDKRVELRNIFDKEGVIPNHVLHDDEYFVKFNLSLPEKLPQQRNKLNGLNYETLEELQMAFDLRPIRNIIVKQLAPKDGDSAKYEIFYRLNSGGINLTPQEIRMSIYYSDFYSMLYRLNLETGWRRLLGLDDPDLHMKDVEFLLRGFAMLVKGNDYSPAMAKFLNNFSKEARGYPLQKVEYLQSLFLSFLASCSDLSKELFQSSAKRFSITIFEAVFSAVCKNAYAQNQMVSGKVDPQSVMRLKADQEFFNATVKRTTDKKNVGKRLERAQIIIQVS
jgi:uncharacterized protein with ParB-like and HNH nuclease domain